MGSDADRITLTLDALRAIAGWAAECAERALPIYEARVVADPRPRSAIEAARIFAAGGKRSASLRKLAMDAHRAGGEAEDPAARAAARAASLAAASAYTHPLADLQQTKHIVGQAAYAALALELGTEGAPGAAEAELAGAIARAPSAVLEVLGQMPARARGSTRVDELMFLLDSGLRAGAAGKGG